MLRRYVGIGALMLALTPAAAQADWMFTPSFGSTFAGDSFGREHLTYGAAIAWLDEEAFGWEADFSYSPSKNSGE